MCTCLFFVGVGWTLVIQMQRRQLVLNTYHQTFLALLVTAVLVGVAWKCYSVEPPEYAPGVGFRMTAVVQMAERDGLINCQHVRLCSVARNALPEIPGHSGDWAPCLLKH